MSEVILNFIKGHETLDEASAFDRFLQQERIRNWVGTDPARRDKIKREFSRVWSDHFKSLEPATHVVQVQRKVEKKPVVTKPRPTFTEQPAPPAGSTRKLNLLCPACTSLDVWTKGHQIECRRCGRYYDNMLDLVPVRAVGPFSYIFGEGMSGVVTATIMIAILLVVYGVFRWA